MSEYKNRGYDVSEAQIYSNLDISALIDTAKFIIVRAGIATREDRNLYHNVHTASGKVPLGYYWYNCALTPAEAKSEAEACIKILNKYPAPELPVFCDIETKEQCELDAETKANIIKAFCDTIAAAGYKAGIYTSWGFIEGIKKQYNAYLKDYPLWLAAWTENPNELSSALKIYNPIIWQWGLDHVNGIGVDGDVSRIDFAIDCKPVPDVKPAPIKIGDTVKVKPGAKFSDGTKPLSFVYVAEFTVYNISRDGTEGLIGIDGQYTGWMYISDLILTSGKPAPEKQSILLGDAVKVKPGALTYGGKQLASFVYTNIYTVMQVGTNSYPDYIVIGDGKNITAAVKASDLIVVL